MTTDALTTTDIYDTTSSLEPGDKVSLTTSTHDYKNPLTVTDAEATTFENPLTGDWIAIELTLEGAQGGIHHIHGVEDHHALRDNELHKLHDLTPHPEPQTDDTRGEDSGPARTRPSLERFEDTTPCVRPLAATEWSEEQRARFLEGRWGGGLRDGVIALLEDHGELPGRELQLRLEASHHLYNVLEDLVEDGTVATRQDPEDGRRTLYTLTPDDVSTTGTDATGTDTTQPTNGEAFVDFSNHTTPDPEAVDLPDGVSVEDVREAAGCGNVRSLADLANALDLPHTTKNTLRVATVELGLYDDELDRPEANATTDEYGQGVQG